MDRRVDKGEGHLAQQKRQTGIHESSAQRYEARAERILDAASTLILRYGFPKTTIDDIAREAGVGKGTLYQHWKTREALFSALMLREKIAMAEEIRQHLSVDPAGATLRGLLKYSALALLHRPLLKALLLRDPTIFGKIVEREQSSEASAEVLAGFTTYLQALREQGLVRTDLSMHTLLALFSSIFLGFFLAAPLLPDALAPADEELAELLAETGHRTLEPREPISESALQIASQNLLQYLNSSVTRVQEQLHGNAHIAGEDDLSGTRPPTRVRGRKGGRSKKLKTADQIAEARHMYADQSRSIEEICSTLGISRASFYRYLKDAQGGQG